jgi:hypothetical protein
MNKLTALTTFLLNLNLFAAEQLESFVDDLTIMPACRTAAAGQIVVCEMDYTAAFYIERFPHGSTPAPLFFAQISAWLVQNDPDRTDANDFPVTVDILDDSTADLEIRIPFTELVTASETVDGPIAFKTKRYTLDD